MRPLPATIGAGNGAIDKEKFERIENNLSNVAHSLWVIRRLGMKMINLEDGEGELANSVIALSEKAGYLSDQSLGLLGGAITCGDFDAWCDAKHEHPI